MKIRNKITIWITGAGLLAALLFSIIIMDELVEQPFELVDKELDYHASALFIGSIARAAEPESSLDSEMMQTLGKLYWFKIFDPQGNLLYGSAMTKFVELPLKKNDTHYTVNATVPLEVTSIDKDDDNSDDIAFRIGIYHVPFEGIEYLLQIARPMEKLWEEIVELLIAIGVGLLFFVLALILLSYFVAGKILQPISDINFLAREISDKTLDKRIPLGKNKDELYVLSSSLNQMFDRLQFSFKRQKEFVANASHELKTPLAMQRLFFDEAMQLDNLSETYKKKVTAQAGVTLRMTQLVKNLLDLSSLEQNEKIDQANGNLTELALSTFGQFEEIFQATDIELTLDIDDSVCLALDKEKMRRMLINLIDNAVKYNLEKNGEICFSLHRDAKQVCMELSNTGQAIPDDALKQVFNQFYRVEKSRSSTFGGSGLGLTIVRRIVELHHGEIMIRNNTSESSGNRIVVTILLPIKHSE